MAEYDVSKYWNSVGSAIADRGGDEVAGDDSPFLRYKRRKLLTLLLDAVPADVAVLEVGSGPGGNLTALKAAGKGRKRLTGVDIAPSMVELARGRGHEVFLTDGATLPFTDGEFDVVYSVTVLQHNPSFERLLGEMCRVARNEVLLFEDTVVADAAQDYTTYVRRPISEYVSVGEAHGFRLLESVPLNVFASDMTESGLLKALDRSGRAEGVPLPAWLLQIEAGLLRITKRLDGRVEQRRGLTKIALAKLGT